MLIMNNKFRLIVFLTYCVLSVSYFQAMTQPRIYESLVDEVQVHDASQQLDKYMEALTKLNRFSGVVLIAKGDTILLNKGYGFASYEFEVHNTSQMKFRICSITKMITAVAILQLQEKGLLDVNDSVSHYLPDYPRGEEITIHQLLSHTSGISSDNLPLEMVVCPAKLEDMLSFFKNKPLEFEPGSDYRYSNAGYYLLSYIIETISGTSYETYIQENILIPSKMKDSFFRGHDYEILKNCASGYCFNETNTLVNGHYVYENFKGGGGLFCTAYDLYLFAKALTDGKLINIESIQTMFTPYHTKENYGYGCHIQSLFDHKCIEHGGMLSSGFKSNLSILLEDDIYIVILSNLFSSWVNEAREALAAIMLDQSYELPSNNPIVIDFAVYDDYVGKYDHPLFKDGYKVQTNEGLLFLPDGKELSPIGTDQFIALNSNMDNIVYRFNRNELGRVVQLSIKGGAPYFQVRCDKI